MTLLSAISRQRDPEEKRTVTNSEFWGAWASGENDLPGVDNATGVQVSRASALGVSAVWACISLIADSIATLPVDTYTVDADGVRNPSRPRPVWMDVPNPEQTKVDFIFNQVASLLADGNAFIYNVLDRKGDVVEAWTLSPDTVQVYRERQLDGSVRLVYYVMISKGQQSPVGPFRIEAGPEMFHVMAFQASSNWPRGIAPLEVARRMFGSGIAGQEMGARFFGHGMNAAGVIETPDEMTIDQARELKKDFTAANSGISKMHLPPVLTAGASFKPIQITPEQSQFIEQRRFSVEEIARFFRVPPYMIGDLAKTTSWGTGVEQQGIGFVTYTLRPWIERLEEAWSRRMLFMQPGVRVAFDVEGLLRGDQAARADYYQKQFYVGAMSPNDIAKAEGRKPIGPDGDTYYYPVAMAPVGTEPIKIAKVAAEEPNLKPGEGIANDVSPVAADVGGKANGAP